MTASNSPTAPALPLSYSREVEEAKAENRPILALESTLITHGLPYPQNLETVQHIERCLRQKGVIPATLAIIEGQIKVGLEDSELKTLANWKTESKATVHKIAAKDLCWAIGLKKWGSTTVSASLKLATLAGIPIFATGGIGGVHRDYHETFDMSEDLSALAEHPILVVSQGAKSILDTQKTYEHLESLGVTVIGHQTPFIPEFYVRGERYPAHATTETLAEISCIFHAKRGLQDRGSLLVCPRHNSLDLMSSADHEAFLQKALQHAEKEGVSGKATTPFLLKEMVAYTEGRSLKTNVDLITENCLFAGDLALELHDQKTI